MYLLKTLASLRKRCRALALTLIRSQQPYQREPLSLSGRDHLHRGMFMPGFHDSLLLDACQPRCYYYMPRRRKQRAAPKSHYSLTDVLQKINSGQCVIRRNAADSALADFGWNRSEIIEAIKLLKEKHFCMSLTSTRNAWWVYDVYKSRLLGENVYIHLYIDDTKGILIINSFKEDKPPY